MYTTNTLFPFKQHNLKYFVMGNSVDVCRVCIVIKSYRMYDIERKEITLKSFISFISLFMPLVSSAYTSISEPPLKKNRLSKNSTLYNQR